MGRIIANSRNAYKAVPRLHLGLSDHISIVLRPAYRPMLIHARPLQGLVRGCWNQNMFKKVATYRQHTDLEENASSCWVNPWNDCWLQEGSCCPYIKCSVVETLRNTRFICVHLMDDLAWTLNIIPLAKKAQQWLHFIWWLNCALWSAWNDMSYPYRILCLAGMTISLTWRDLINFKICYILISG